MCAAPSMGEPQRRGTDHERTAFLVRKEATVTAASTATSVVSPTAGHESRLTAWKFTSLLIVLYIINWADKAVLGLAAQPLAEDLGLTASQIGFVGSAFFVAFTIGGFFAGLLNRWLTLKWALVVLAVGWSVAMLPLVLAATFTALLLGRILLGFLEGPSGALVHTAVYSWHPQEKRGVPSACITACASVAKLALAPVLAVVIARFGWEWAFLLLAAIGILWTAVWVPTWRVGPYGGDKTSVPAKGGDAPSVPWRKVMVTPTFVGGALAVMSMYALVSMVLTWLPSYFELGLGYGRVQAGTMFGFPSIVSLAIMAVVTPVADRMISRGVRSRVVRGIVPAVGLLLCGIAMSTLPLISVPGVAVAVVSIGYGLGVCVFPLFNSGLSEIVPPHQVAGALGVFLAIMSIGGLLAPALTGLIVDASATQAEGYARAFQLFGVLAVVGSLAALATFNPERDKARLMAAAG